ncbi:uncharacterized protein LOC120341099 isoform X1 [Styela clava]
MRKITMLKAIPLIVIATFLTNSAAVAEIKCGALRYKIGNLKTCEPKPGSIKELQACYDPCEKTLIDPKNCTDYPQCCIYNCKCVMKGAGFVKIPDQLRMPDAILKSASLGRSKIPRIKGCKRSKPSATPAKPELASKAPTPKSVSTRKTTAIPPRRPKASAKPKPIKNKKPKPMKTKKPKRIPVKPIKRKPGPKKPSPTKPKRKPRPTRPTTTSRKPTTKPCATKKPKNPFASLFADRFSFFLGQIGFEADLVPC